MKRSEAKLLGLQTYSGGKSCSRCHQSERYTTTGQCINCMKSYRQRRGEEYIEKERERNRLYASQNVEKYVENKRKWRKENPHAVEKDRLYSRERARMLYATDPEFKKKKLQRDKIYVAENRDKINKKNYHRYHNDPEFRLYDSMRKMVRRVLTISGTSKKMGYTSQELRLHLESLWQEGMSWENYGKWHIDHIKSIKSFRDEGVTDPKIVNALSNLQPLWATENISKGAK